MSEEDFRSLILAGAFLIDVRAPIEFAAGSIPHSVNLPLINNEERHQIGIEYKERGQEAAIELGHRLVNGVTREQRTEAWTQFIDSHPGAMLFCFRGGLRSHTAAEWIREQKRTVNLIPGGYKAIRKFLLKSLEDFCSSSKLILVEGKTGAGKTRFLKRTALVEQSLDLESLAKHKGSAFGAIGPLGTQPTQATFENNLAAKCLRKPRLVEAESRSIGALQIPAALILAMERAPVAILELNEKERIENLAREYVVDKATQFGGDILATQEFHLAALFRIQKKLGDQNYRKIREQMLNAFTHGLEILAHEEWIATLLQHYYDPLYLRQIERKKDRVQFRGTGDEIERWVLAQI